jgi:N-methylhydantoinase A
MHFADIVKEESAALITSSDDFAAASVEKVLQGLEEKLDKFAGRFSDNYPDHSMEFGVEARYKGQIWAIDVPLQSAKLTSESDQERLFGAFHELHERVMAVRDPDSAIEFLNWRARVTVNIPRAGREFPAAAERVGRSASTRTCYFSGTGKIETPVFKPADLLPGTRVSGPAVIEEPTTTLVIYPGMAAQVADTGNYLLHIEEDEA